jgi:hypothetical protein
MPTLVNQAESGSYTLCSFRGKTALEIWPVQNLGRLYVSREAIATFETRAMSGEFAKKTNTPSRIPTTEN